MVKASDIPDATMLAVVGHINQAGNRFGGSWAYIWDIEPLFPEFPPKVVRAKLKQLLKRKLIEGCPCGCRGDWELYHPGMICKPQPQDGYSQEYPFVRV